MKNVVIGSVVAACALLGCCGGSEGGSGEGAGSDGPGGSDGSGTDGQPPGGSTLGDSDGGGDGETRGSATGGEPPGGSTGGGTGTGTGQGTTGGDTGDEPPGEACTDPTELSGVGHASAQRELCLLQSLPGDVIDGIRGSIPSNPSCICDYKRAADLLVAALAGRSEGDLAAAFASLEEAIDRQDAGGDFGGQSASAVSFFVAWTSHALLLLQASEWADDYASRIEAMLPALESALDFLMGPGRDELWRVERGWPNRCFIAANAYGHAAVLLDRPDAQPDAQRYIDRVFSEGSDGLLDIWRAYDGVFLEGGTAACGPGSDSSYQGVGVWMFLRYLLYYPDPHPTAKTAAVDAGHWLTGMIKTDGSISTEGNARTGPNAPENKSVNTREVRKGLVYYGLMVDPAGIDAAARSTGEDDGVYTPPSIGSIDDTSVAPGDPVSIPLVLDDDESPAVSLRVGVESSDPTVLDPALVQIEGRYTERILRATAGSPGTATITVTVEDLGYRCEAGRTDDTSFTLTVTP